MSYSMNHLNMNDNKIDSIKDIKAPMSKINLIAIAVEFVRRFMTKDNHEVRVFKFADRTACINMCLYDEVGACIQPGDICHLTQWFVV
ncbi:hypothetical protein BLA29_008784 [Euroglyphus maynei]|uniref:Uncharacterized protein n=1 Tax=Euroglyphus maynei TaxID=6958 RepID=A0A1Y3AVE3_EURMA|nr:hypothetical protein BLA29_008784 [Euroglyphus maynei]